MPVASSQSAGGTPSFHGGHEDRSAKGARIEAPRGGALGLVFLSPIENRLRAGLDPGVEIGGAYRPIWRAQSTSV